MKYEYFKIRDRCRMGLVKYLEQVLNELPEFNNPKILDIGCGSGVPTLWLSENFAGIITAMDSDSKAIDYLQQKIMECNLQHRIKTICQNFDEFKCETGDYNIILAEGFLNVDGFKFGFLRLNDFLSKNGVIIIHDEYKDHNSKLEFIVKNNYTIIDTLLLNENIWWNDYYKQLEIELNEINDIEMKQLFIRDIEELKLFKTEPSLFQSIYYVAMKK